MGVGRHFRQSTAKRPTVTCEGLETRRLFTVLYVDINKNASSNPGVWATASTSLQATINASVAGDEIRVADGTYLPSTTGDRTASFVLKSGVTLTGGWAGRSSVDPNTRDPLVYVTKLSGNIGSSASSTDNSYRVLTGTGLSSATILDGITVRDAVNDSTSNKKGGGLYLEFSSLTLRNCVFTNNSAGTGGGIYTNSIAGQYQFILEQCTFTSNTSTSFGGAVAAELEVSVVASDCIFSDNRALGTTGSGYGGALLLSASSAITRCTFTGNQAAGWGGAIRFLTATVTDCTFTNNVAGDQGGGLLGVIGSITGSTFTGNSATSMGGGALLSYSTTNRTLAVSNCTFTDNSAAEAGALVIGGGISPTVSSCTFTRNRGANFYGVVKCTGSASNRGSIVNCAFNGNSASGASVLSATFTNVTNSSFVGSPGAFVATSGNDILMSGCVFTKNDGAYGLKPNSSGGANYARNLIMWGNSFSTFSAANLTYSDVQYTGVNGTGVIHADPQFVRTPSPGADTVWGTADDDYGDLRLQATSPCIDAGSNAYVPTGVTTDLAGQARFADVSGVRDPGVITDMGAYEAVTTLAVSDRSFLTDATSPTVKFVFNANLATSTLNGGDLQLVNQTTGDLFDTSTLATTAYDLATFSASWLLPTNLPDGNYHATLPAGSIADAGMNTLATTDQLDFFILAGDASRDRFVDTQDFNLLAENFGGASKVFSQGDFNYSTIVDSTDFDIFAGKYGIRLAAPSEPVDAAPSAPSGSIFATRSANRDETDDSVLA